MLMGEEVVKVNLPQIGSSIKPAFPRYRNHLQYHSTVQIFFVVSVELRKRKRENEKKTQKEERSTHLEDDKSLHCYLQRLFHRFVTECAPH